MCWLKTCRELSLVEQVTSGITFFSPAAAGVVPHYVSIILGACVSRYSLT